MSQLILRNEALRHCTLFEESPYKILQIQAQAGQGKTVLATQFDEATKTPFAWTTCTRATNSPRLLFGRVLSGISAVLPDFPEDAISSALRQQLVDAEFIEIATRRLCSELEQPGCKITLVIDDAHLLDDSDNTKQLLKRLIELSPAEIKFIFLTRYPLTLDNAPLFPPQSAMHIDKTLLAFSREEIAILYNDVYGEPVTTAKIRELYEATEGWVSGLKLLHTSGTIRRLVHADATSLGMFFDELLLPSLTPAEYNEMILLALLDELPEALLRENATLDMVRWIEDLVSKNCFVRKSRGERQSVFRLHHIFQEYLLSQAKGRVSSDDQAAFLTAIGDWYLEAGQPIDGLNCFAKAENWSRIADAMKLQCLPLLGANQHNFLMGLLSNTPSEIVSKNGWLCFALGSAQFALAPPTAGPTLNNASKLFRNESDMFGELLACCTLLNYQVLTTGEYGGRDALIERTELLYETLAPNLPNVLLVNCAQALAVGKAYYQAKLDDAMAYIDRTRTQFAECAPNSVPWYRLVEIVIMLFEGKVYKALDKFSPLFNLANSPWVSPTVRFTIFASYANAISMQGMSLPVQAPEKEIDQRWSPMLAQSHIGADLTKWETDRLISLGKYGEAGDLLENCPILEQQQGPHVQSKMFAYKAIVLSRQGRTEEMYAALRTALRLRAKSKGPFYVHLVHTLSMTALALAGNHRSAKRIFAKCTRPRENAPHFYHDPLLHASMAAIHIDEGNRKEAENCIRTMLDRFRLFANEHHFGWTPAIMKKVLRFAVAHDIDKQFALKLARKRLDLDILDDGTMVPLLRLRTIGTMDLKKEDGRLNKSDLSPAWIELLRLLANAQNHTIMVQQAMDALWPGEDSTRQRSKFDTMLSRLRSKISKEFGKEAAKTHFRIQSGRLSLTHTRVDTEEALRLAALGQEHASAGRTWLGDSTFTEMSTWLGADFHSEEAPLLLPKRLEQPILKALITWAALLEHSLDHDRALAVATKALTLDPINDDLRRQRYNLLTALKRPTEAARSLMEYRSVLVEYDFEQEDVDHIIDNLLSDALSE